MRELSDEDERERLITHKTSVAVEDSRTEGGSSYGRTKCEGCIWFRERLIALLKENRRLLAQIETLREAQELSIADSSLLSEGLKGADSLISEIDQALAGGRGRGRSEVTARERRRSPPPSPPPPPSDSNNIRRKGSTTRAAQIRPSSSASLPKERRRKSPASKTSLGTNKTPFSPATPSSRVCSKGHVMITTPPAKPSSQFFATPPSAARRSRDNLSAYTPYLPSATSEVITKKKKVKPPLGTTPPSSSCLHQYSGERQSSRKAFLSPSISAGGCKEEKAKEDEHQVHEGDLEEMKGCLFKELKRRVSAERSIEFLDLMNQFTISSIQYEKFWEKSIKILGRDNLDLFHCFMKLMLTDSSL